MGSEIGCVVVGESTWLPLNGARYAESFADEFAVAEDVLLVFDAALLPERSLVGRMQNRVQPQSSGPFRGIVQIASGIDMVVAAGPGASTASVTMELLAACGASRVVSVGTAAATSDAVSDGDICLVNTAVLIGAASPYPPAGQRGGPLFEALDARIDSTVAALTTLWPFRVDAAELAAVPNAVVEMEAATLQAVGAHVAVAVESIVVVSDRYQAGEWHLGDRATTRHGLDRAVEIAIAGLAETR